VQNKHTTKYTVPSEIGEDLEAYLDQGCWSAFGITCSTQQRPVSYINDAIFVMDHMPSWMFREFDCDHEP